MRLAVFAFSRRGLETAERIRAALAGPGDVCTVYAPERLSGEGRSEERRVGKECRL